VRTQSYAEVSMLRWFRVHASRIALTAIVSLAGLGTSAISPHEDDCHDAACSAMAVEHDAAAHRFSAPPTGTDAHPLHCLVCHLVRSFRPLTEVRMVFTPAPQAGATVHIDFFSAPAATTPAARPPLRAPPSSPVFA